MIEVNRIAGESIGDGQYLLLEICGNGGMAEVWKARHQTTGEFVAIKFLLPPKQAEAMEPQRVRFLEEAELGKTLHHPNLVFVTDSGTDVHGLPYLVMRYVRGVSLRSFFRERVDALANREGPQVFRLALQDLFDVIDQILDALAYLDAHGIVHRDLKPENIKISRDAAGHLSVHLLDLGIAKRLHQSTRATLDGYVIGTLDYMAPEQIGPLTEPLTGTKWGVGTHTDMYALCAMLYEVFGGQLPYPEEEAGVISREARVLTRLSDPNDLPTPLNDLVLGLDPLLAEMIQQGMAKQPWERLTRAELRSRMRRAFGRISEHVGAASVAPTTPLPYRLTEPPPVPTRTAWMPPSVSPVRPHRARWIAGALVAMAMIVLVFIVVEEAGIVSRVQAPAASSASPVPSAPAVAPTVAPAPTTVSLSPQKAERGPRELYEMAYKVRKLGQCRSALVLLNDALKLEPLDPSLHDSIQREIRACSTP